MFATDTPYRMIELADPPRTIWAHARNDAFDRAWNDVLEHVRERSVCR
jgi:hypothetical protein